MPQSDQSIRLMEVPNSLAVNVAVRYRPAYLGFLRPVASRTLGLPRQRFVGARHLYGLQGAVWKLPNRSVMG